MDRDKAIEDASVEVEDDLLDMITVFNPQDDNNAKAKIGIAIAETALSLVSGGTYSNSRQQSAFPRLPAKPD
jgi:predicted dinucleotide-binding enzyme